MIRIIFIIEAGRSREHYILLELKQVRVLGRRALGLRQLSGAENFLLLLITVICDVFRLILCLSHTALLLEVEPLTFSDVSFDLRNRSLLG